MENTSQLTLTLNSISISNWITNLSSHRSSQINPITSSDVISKHLFNEKQVIYQIISADIKRTRVADRSEIPSFSNELSQWIVFYCEYNNIYYKQGLNELIAPFLLLKLKYNKVNELFEVYNLCTHFIDFFFNNYYYQLDLSAFRSSCAIIGWLVKYHLPELANLFDRSNLTPQIYSTNWLWTSYANKCGLVITYHLWDFLISSMDQAMIYYIVIAVLKYYHQKMMSMNSTIWMEFVTQIKINDWSMLFEVLALAKEIKNNTPFSIYLLMNSLEIFKVKSTNIKNKYEMIKPDELMIFPMFPSEILYLTFPTVWSCYDVTCKQFTNYFEEMSLPKGNSICNVCKAVKTRPVGSTHNNINNNNNNNSNNIHSINCIGNSTNNPYTSIKYITYFLLDLRLGSNKEYQGFLPNMQIFKLPKTNNFLNKKTINNYTAAIKTEWSKLEKDRNYHFILITSNSTNFIKFDNSFYVDNTSWGRIDYNTSWNKNKEISLNLVKNYIKEHKGVNKKLERDIQEYFNLRIITTTLIDNNYKYISFAYDGFDAIHWLGYKLSIPFTTHSRSNCKLCLEYFNALKKIENVSLPEKTFQEFLDDKTKKIYQCYYNNSECCLMISRNLVMWIRRRESKKQDIYYEIYHQIQRNLILAVDCGTKEEEANGDNCVRVWFSKNCSLSELEVISIFFSNYDWVNEIINSLYCGE